MNISSSLKIKILLFLLGTITMVFQIIFIREFISAMDGNELIIGIVMTNWLLITGLGAYTASKINFKKQLSGENSLLLILLSIIPLITIALLYLLKYLAIPEGIIISLIVSFLLSAIVLFPSCFLSGIIFTNLSASLSLSEDKNLISKAYSTESLGSLTGGLIFSLILGKYFNSYQITGIIAGISIIVYSALFLEKTFIKKALLLIIGISVPLIIFVFNPDLQIRKLLFPNQEIIVSKSTPYSNVTLTRQAGQTNIYENNSLLFYSDNNITNEEAVHYVMPQHDNPKRVLLISGIISGMIPEVLKYNIESVCCSETNPDIIRLWKIHTDNNHLDDKVLFIESDIRKWLSVSNIQFDIILINLPPPSTLGLNRFYTDEFFSLLKKHCNKESIICTSLPSSANYAGPNALSMNSCLWLTLNKNFKNIKLITGEKNYFIASDNDLHKNITQPIKAKGIETLYVNENYINDSLLNMRSKVLSDQLDLKADINKDFNPVLFSKQTGIWLSYFGTNYYILIAIPLVLFIIFFLTLKPVTLGLYTGGFTASSLEIIMMMAYQVYFGSLYLDTALFFAVFMSGLALGSRIKIKAKRNNYKKIYSLVQFLIALTSLLILCFILLFKHIPQENFFSRVIFYIPVTILSILVGYEFNIASFLMKGNYSRSSGIIYSSDLLGSALGALISVIFIIPKIGLIAGCISIALLNISSGIINQIRRSI
jgi:predicted membrane-bound spermidine synthase